MDNFVDINGKHYAIDLEKLMDFIGANNSVQTIINQNYGNTEEGLTLATKDVTETKDSVSDIMSEYRYNIISNLLTLITTPISDGNGIIITEDTNNMHMGQKLAFNTLLAMEIIYEIDTEE